MSDNKRNLIYLAALLHDIGKFYQRADTGSVSTSKYLKDYCKEESSFCPSFNGVYSHKHVLWTAQFIDDYKSVFNNLVDAGLEDLTVKDNLLNLAAGHHLSQDQLSELGAIIKEADCLSSGMDRASADALSDAQDEEYLNWDAFKQKRMVSILETVKTAASKNEWKHLPVDKLSLSKDFFPKDSFDSMPNYSDLWEKFKSEFKFIQADTYKAFSETLLSLLLKYTSCIPSSTINFADVSLYDHLKTTAALSVCLYDYQQSGEQGDAPFLLVGADFSGIQSYIYQIVSKYAAKNLKGRSFYIRLLSDAVVRYLLKELNLFQANVIYNSGGGFYLLAPNTQFVRDRLKAAVQNVEQHLFEAHGTALFVAIDSVELSKDALMHKNGCLGDVWGCLFKLRDVKKSAKFASQIENSYSTFFEPSLCGGDAKRDSITGEEFSNAEKPISKDGLLLKTINAQQIELGKALRSYDLLVVKDGEPLTYWSDEMHISPADLGFTYYFLKTERLAAKKEQLKASADSVSVVTMNGKNGNCDFLRTVDGINNVYSLDFYGGNESDCREVSTFEQMCENAERFSRMGVLRMDVDNLGSIFQEGISNERATLSRYAALSRSFDFFFSGYLNTIWREVDPSRSFIIYSGGDDVFIVGSWDVTIQLAKRINDDFKEFCCNNPAFSLSGGIAIISPKYPIMKGADESDSEEKNAKNHSCVGQEKNSISFMDMPLNWDLEYPAVASLKDTMVDLLESDKMPKSFLSKVMTHYANAKIQNHTITAPKTYWMLTYDLSRMKARSGADLNVLIDNCIKEVCNKTRNTLNGHTLVTEYHPLELWTFAARWAELVYRSNNER